MAEDSVEVARGKVATQISDTELAFNVGLSSGIQKDDTVTINDNIVVTDPMTKQELGSVGVPRLSFRVYLLAEGFCVARVTDRVSSIGKAGAASVRPLKKVRLSASNWHRPDGDVETSSIVDVVVGEDAVFFRKISDDLF